MTVYALYLESGPRRRMTMALSGNLAARRCLRRMLEHSWEHQLEISERLDRQAS